MILLSVEYGVCNKTHVLIHGSEMTIIDGEMMWNAGSLKNQSLKTKENTRFSPRELHVYGFDGLWVFRFTSQTSKTTKNNQFLGWWWCPLLGAHGSPTVAQLPLCVPPSIESATPLPAAKDEPFSWIFRDGKSPLSWAKSWNSMGQFPVLNYVKLLGSVWIYWIPGFFPQQFHKTHVNKLLLGAQPPKYGGSTPIGTPLDVVPTG